MQNQRNKRTMCHFKTTSFKNAEHSYNIENREESKYLTTETTTNIFFLYITHIKN